jgi:hypothetical protein
VRKTGKPIAQVAHDLGAHEGTLANWIARHRVERGEAESLTAMSGPSWRSCAARWKSSGWSVSSSAGWSSEGGDALSRAAFIADQKASYVVPCAVACRALGVSESWFFKWHHRPPTLAEQRRAEVDAAVKAAFGASKGTYGSPGIHARLVGAG